MSTIDLELILLERLRNEYGADTRDLSKRFKDLNKTSLSQLRAKEPEQRIKTRTRLRNEAFAEIKEGMSHDFDLADEGIVKESQLTGMSFLERALIAARAVARVHVQTVKNKSGYGSGVMISPNLFMTNHHVLPDSKTAERSKVEFGFLTSVFGARQTQYFALDPERFFRTSEPLDTTIVAVEPKSSLGKRPELRGWCHLIRESGKAIGAERVNIIQHPGGEPMQVAMRDNMVLETMDDFLLYSADTNKGSSGSPVLNDQWQLAALHHRGVPLTNDEGQWLRKDGEVFQHGDKREDIEWVGNKGTRVSRIVQHFDALDLSPEERRLWEAALKPAEPVDLWSHIEQLFDPAISQEQLTEAATTTRNFFGRLWARFPGNWGS